MSFFRTVIYLLIWSEFNLYIAYREMAEREKNTELKTVADLLDEIEYETLYRALLTADRRTLQIILLKIQGYSTKEIAPLVGLHQELSMQG